MTLYTQTDVIIFTCLMTAHTQSDIASARLMTRYTQTSVWPSDDLVHTETDKIVSTCLMTLNTQKLTQLSPGRDACQFLCVTQKYNNMLQRLLIQLHTDLHSYPKVSSKIMMVKKKKKKQTIIPDLRPPLLSH